MKDVMALRWAAYQGDLDEVQRLVASGVNWMKRITMVEHASIWRHRKARKRWFGFDAM